MNHLVQTSSNSPKNYGRDIKVRLMAIPYESLPLCFLDLRHNNNPTAQDNIKPSKNRAKTYD